MGCNKMEMLLTIWISLKQNMKLGCTLKYRTIVSFPTRESGVMQMH